MERNQFTFYSSFFNAISRIKKKAARADAYDAICAYALRGIEPDLDTIDDTAAIAFEFAKPTLDASKRKAESGSKGGSSKQTEANGKQTASKTENSASKKKNKDKNKNKNKNKCYITREERDIAFDKFWAEYPRKVGKVDARKAFAKVEVPVDDLIAAVKKQKESSQWTSDGGQYIPNPSTWLNQGRWEDELPELVEKGIPKGASGKLGEAELDAIRKMMEED